MHVGFVVNNYLPHVGGVELHVAALARTLRRRGHQVTIVALGETPSAGDEDGIHVVRLQERLRIGDVLAFPPPGTGRRLRRLLSERGVDLVSVHTRFFPMTWLGIGAARASGLPVVLTEHGSDHVASDSKLIALAARLVDETFGRWALRRADRVLGVSEQVVSFVGRLGRVPAEVFYNAIELPAAGPEPKARPGRLVFVGRLVAGKGWPEFVEAVTQLRQQGLEVSGTMLGGGPDEAAVRRAAPAEVEVLGRVPPDEVAGHLRGATLVNPTTLSEGFQTTLLEALAVGGRIVTYPVPGAQALADDGAPLRITERRDLASLVAGLQAMLADPSAPYPPEKLEKWSWDARATQFEQVAAALIARRPR